MKVTYAPVGPIGVVHWLIPGQLICEEYVMGDDVIDQTVGTTADVNCEECIEWIHA